MKLHVDEKNKTVYLSDFEVTSEELKDLGRRFEGYVFKEIETFQSNEYEEYENESQTYLEFAQGTLLSYDSPATCYCEDRNNCDKLIKCKNLLN